MSIIGELRPKSKFLGNSVSTTMEGENRVRLLGAASDGGECALTSNMPALLTLCRICDHDAEYVRTRDTVRENGPRAWRYMHCEERENGPLL